MYNDVCVCVCVRERERERERERAERVREREREREEREVAKPHCVILSLSPVFSHVSEQSTEKSLPEWFATLRPVASDGHAHPLT